MRIILFIALSLTISGFGQTFRFTGEKLIFVDEGGFERTVDAYDGCYCDPIYNDSTNLLEGFKPLTYPIPAKKNGLWGGIDKKGNTVWDFVFNEPRLFIGQGTVVLKEFEMVNHSWKAKEGSSYLSVLDSNGLEKEKYFVNDMYKGTFLASKEHKFWGLLDSRMMILLEFKYIGAHYKGKEFRFSTNGYLSLREHKAESRFGAVNYKGETIIPFKWKLISYIIEDEEHIYAMNEHLKRGYINIEGQTTLAFKFEKIPRTLTDSNLVRTKDYSYFLDKDLKQIGRKYQAYEKKGNLWFYKQDGKWGIMDANRKIIIPNIYSSIMDGPRIKGNKEFKCYIVVKNGRYGLISATGDSIIETCYECLCGLSYYAPIAYYVEFQKGEISYKFNEKGELIEKGGKSGKNCFCE